MKPPKFHVGQAVALARPMRDIEPGAIGVGRDPKHGEVLIITELTPEPRGNTWYLTFDINPVAEYWQDDYRAVQLLPDEALAKLLSETLEPVTA